MSATEPRPLTVGSLFSGIGGIDLGLERAGMRVVWQSEIDPYASRVLAKHWPDVPNLGDITKVDWSAVERPDVICGGYPCQPFSYAGRRAGTDDARHLWPHFADALRNLRPRWALLENVPGHLSLGFDEVLADLAALGFDAEWELLPAAAFGAPHLRYRLFVVAHAQIAGRQARSGDGVGVGPGTVVGQPSRKGGEGDVAYANGQPVRVRPGSLDAPPGTAEGREEERERVRSDVGDGGTGGRAQASDVADAEGVDGERPFPSRNRKGQPEKASGDSGAGLADTDSPVRNGAWGSGETVFGPEAVERLGRCRSSIGGVWESEPDVGRVAHGIPSRVDRLRALGNAVVPQVAEYVGRLIVNADA